MTTTAEAAPTSTATDAAPIVCGDDATRRALVALDLPFIATQPLNSAGEAAAVAAGGEGPFVLKLISDVVVHKSDAGLVRLNVAAGDVEAGYLSLTSSAERLGIDDGQVVVQPMAPAGLDLFIGCSRDEVLGPVVLAGLGGVTIELFEDVARRLPPISIDDAHGMLTSLASYPLVTGYRGAAAYPSRAFEELLAAVSEYVSATPELTELDLNPVRLLPDGTLSILDARSTWTRPSRPASSEPRPSRDLGPLLTPRSIAIVGASRDLTRPGGRLVNALVRGGFAGPIYPINPAKGATVAGLPAWTDLESLPECPDLVCVAVSAESTLAVLKRCVALQVPAVMTLASGFSETNAAGAELEERMRKMLRGSNTVMCGPNTIGLANPSHQLAAHFSQGATANVGRDSGVCVVAQSGAIVGSLVSREIAKGYGIGAWVTVGNQTDLDVADYVDHFCEQPSTRSIAIFLEGVKDGARLRAALRNARERGVPVVVFKSGLSEEGSRAVTAHSGALAGAGEVYRAMFAQEAVVHVSELTSLLEVAWVLGHAPRPAADAIAILTTSGGAGSATVDLVAHAGMSVATLARAASGLVAVLPDLAQVGNPLDVTAEGAFKPGVVRESIKLMALDASIICVVLTSITGDEAQRVATEIADAADAVDVPVLVTWLIDQSLAADGMHVLSNRGVRLFDEPARMIAAASALTQGALDFAELEIREDSHA